EEEKERIHQAVLMAESKTSGEVVPMIVNVSARYTEVELFGMVVGGTLGTLATFYWHDPWGSQLSHLWPMIGAATGYLLCRIPLVKRRLLPRRRADEAVHERSLAAFIAEGLHYTRNHTGILIFISLFEHEVEVLADQGINEKVPASTWEEVVGIVTAGLKSGHACDGLCKAITRCGEILSEQFPRSPDDEDELSNRLVTGN
ncbi:MAG: hypothetical protein OEN50_13680, partial [Deltaproteobacteria bacterium]|nr:hypothetical protein [Deltaproteobacteria bacterium]